MGHGITNYYLAFMNPKDKYRIKSLLEKYNDVLLNSISIALAEDLINLIVVNGEDRDFELLEMMKDRKQFREFVTAEFLRMNSNHVLKDLKSMEEEFFPKTLRRKSIKGNQGKLEF